MTSTISNFKVISIRWLVTFDSEMFLFFFLVRLQRICLFFLKTQCAIQEKFITLAVNSTVDCVNNKMLEYDWLLTALICGSISRFRSKLSDLTCPITNISVL